MKIGKILILLVISVVLALIWDAIDMFLGGDFGEPMPEWGVWLIFWFLMFYKKDEE